MTERPVGWVPEFPGQRPPFQAGNDIGRWFEPGHELSTVHGAYSPRRVEPLAGEILGHLLADESIAHLAAPRWRLALLALCRSEARVQLLEEYVTRAGEESGDGVGDLDSERVRSAYALLHRCETRAITLRARLGLDPLGAARLGRDRASEAVDVARLMERLEREEREREESGDGG
jgi:hypothetical protein